MKANSLLLPLLMAGLPVISQAQNALPCVQGKLGQALVSQTFAPQKAQFTTLVDITPSSNTLQNSVGLSQGAKTEENQFATWVRFNADGLIEARNGEQFSVKRRVRYHADMTYRVRMDVNLAAHTYSVWVQLQDARDARPFIRIARNFAFNPKQASLAQLDTLGVRQAAGAGVPDFTLGDALQACKLTVQGGEVAQVAQASLAAQRSGGAGRPPSPPPPPNADCSLIVPENPLSPAGLATPYQLVATDPANGACSEVNPSQRAFVEAVILDPHTGHLSVYAPLVIDKGTKPAVAPVLPTLPRDAIVAIWFGYNGDNLTLQGSGRRGASLDDGNCVNGLEGSVFGQFAYCNAPAFFDAAKAAFDRGLLVVPALGTGIDRRACPTSRSFWVVDQDPSDNVPSEYLLINGRFAQNTALNRQNNPGFAVIVNPSDERLVVAALDPALHCTPFSAPNLADPGHNVTAMALNEIQAAVFQEAPRALIPSLDPMVLVDGERNLEKLNLYRVGVGQRLASNVSNASAAEFCQNYRDEAPSRFILDKPYLVTAASPVPADANSLFTFMANRYVNSYEILECRALLGERVNMRLTKNANGVVVDATLR